MEPKRRGPKPQLNICHPERKHFANKLCVSCYRKKWRKTPKGKLSRLNDFKQAKRNRNKLPFEERQKKMREKVYDLSPEEYANLRILQGQVCAICKTNKTLVIDHDHAKTKKTGVRGLLCIICNSFLGRYERNPSVLQNLVEYLKNPPFKGRLKTPSSPIE